MTTEAPATLDRTWVTVSTAAADGTVFEILAQVPPAVERRLPRDRHADPRLQRRRSDLDDVRDHRHPPSAGWNTLTLTEPVAYEALRISGGNGYCNVAELQFIIAVIDKTDLAVHLDDAAALTESEWTPNSWTTLATARDAAQTVADDKGATQKEVDTASAVLAADIASLVAA